MFIGSWYVPCSSAINLPSSVRQFSVLSTGDSFAQRTPGWLFFDDRVELRNEPGDVTQSVDVGIQAVFNLSHGSFTIFPSSGQCKS